MSEKSSSRVTIDHAEIKSWIEEKGGRPVKVKVTGDDGDIGILRIDFEEEDGPEENLEEISWEVFFEQFEKKRLAFLYQIDGESRFFKLISRDN